MAIGSPIGEASDLPSPPFLLALTFDWIWGFLKCLVTVCIWCVSRRVWTIYLVSKRFFPF